MAAEAAARKKAWIEADQGMAATLNEDANLKADAAAQTLAQLEAEAKMFYLGHTLPELHIIKSSVLMLLS